MENNKEVQVGYTPPTDSKNPWAEKGYDEMAVLDRLVRERQRGQKTEPAKAYDEQKNGEWTKEKHLNQMVDEGLLKENGTVNTPIPEAEKKEVKQVDNHYVRPAYQKLSKEELSERGKERYTAMSDEEKRELKGKFYDYENKPNSSRLQQAMEMGRPIIAVHTTTFGMRDMNHPFEIGLTAMTFNKEKGKYEEAKNGTVSFFPKAPKEVLNQAVANTNYKNLFNCFEYNGVSMAEYLNMHTDTPEVVANNVRSFIRQFDNAEVVSFNRDFNAKALSHLDLNILGTIDLMAVANESNENSVLFSGKASINNIAEQMPVGTVDKRNPVQAYEKTAFLACDFVNYVAKTLEWEVGSELKERPKDTISLDDLKQYQNLPFGQDMTLPHTTDNGMEVKDGMTSAELGNLFSDKFNAKADVVVGDVQKVGEVNIPHVSESNPYKEMQEGLKDNLTESYLAKICASLDTIMKQNEIIMQSLLRNGKTLEQTKAPIDREEEYRRRSEKLEMKSSIDDER